MIEGTENFLGQIRELIKVYRPDQGKWGSTPATGGRSCSARLMDPIDPP
jgi:hypothetical protein